MNNLNNLFTKDLQDICNDLQAPSKDIVVERPKSEYNAHLASSIALVLAKQLKKSPLEIANLFKEKLLKTGNYAAIEIAGPGFINILFTNKILQNTLTEVFELKDKFGASPSKNLTYNLEEVSANPTGFLHVGHARNAAISDSVGRILKFAGYNVQTEYYINDAGNQINVLAVTVLYHYQKLLGSNPKTPEEMYGGDMYDELAQIFIDKYGDKFKDVVWEGNIIQDSEALKVFKQESTDYFLTQIKQQLKDFNVEIKYYSSEKKSYDEHWIESMLEIYNNLKVTYEKDGALWLKTTDFGDDKDRVLVKSNGDYTYITPDLATHHERIKRSKADKLINFWGGDHHGYIVRMRAGLALLGHSKDILSIDTIQMVRLIKDGQEYKMSKRRGTAVWLVDLLEMVGSDALRYMLVSKNPSSHMDFDLDLVTAKNSSNPVFYAQYATARISNLLNLGKKNNLVPKTTEFTLLTTDKELQLILSVNMFNKVLEASAQARLPHLITDYIQVLTRQFHSYYAEKNVKIIDEQNKELSEQRLGLIMALDQVFRNLFNLIGINIVENM